MIEYSNDGWFGFLSGIWRCSFRSGSVLLRSVAVSICSGLLASGLVILSEERKEIWDKTGIDTLTASQLWAAMTASLVFLIGFRTNKAYGRFWDGTTLLHQMFGEWFDAVSCLVAFSSLSIKKQPGQVAQFRHTLIRLMSLCHGCAMEEISNLGSQPYLCVDVGGLDQKTLKYLTKAKYDKNLNFNTVEVVIHMIQTLVVFNSNNGVLKIPPPILSRVFQTISRGQVNLANAKKITSTLFPFPYAQLIGVLLIIFSLSTPVALASVITSWQWAAVFTAVPVMSLFALNYVACQLEMPFGTDPNDLPLAVFQDHMNSSLLMLIRPETDLVPHVHEHCATDYEDIKAHISLKQPRDFMDDLDTMIDEEEERVRYSMQGVEIAVRAKSTIRRTRVEPKDNQDLQAPAQSSAQASATPSDPTQPAKSEPTKQQNDQVQEPAIRKTQSQGAASRKSMLQAKQRNSVAFEKGMEVLNGTFEELVGHINGLSAQMRRSTNEFRNLMANANHLSYQMDAYRHYPHYTAEERSQVACWNCGGSRTPDICASNQDRVRNQALPLVPREHRWGCPNIAPVASAGVAEHRGLTDTI